MTEVKYDGIQFSLAFQEYHPIFWLSFWSNEIFLDKYRKLTGVDVGFIYIIRNGEEFTGYVEANASEKIYNSLKNKISKKWIDSEFIVFNRLLKKIKKLVEEKSDNLNEVYKILSEIYPYSNAFYLLSSEIEKQITLKLSPKFSETDLNKVIAKATIPLKETFFAKHAKDVRSLASKIPDTTSLIQLRELYEKDKKVKRLFDNLKDRYFCLTSLNGEERTAQSFIPEVFEALNKKDEIKDIKIPKEVEQDVYLLRAMTYFKDEISTFIIPYVRFGLDKQWKQLANGLDMTLNQLELLTFEEVYSKNKNIETSSKLRKEVTFFYHAPNKKTVITEGDAAQRQINEIIEQVDVVSDKVSEIQGKVGSSGIVKGVVQKIMSSKDISSFKEGNILVTVYTAPEFVPAMKKAIAIITDTGGVTSHAAIVARELGKPCIVNTKISTRVLNDGDFIEVDANKGILRIIKGNK